MKFSIYQFTTNLDLNKPENKAMLELRRDVTCGDELTPEHLSHYKLVADIEADNLEHAFEIGNVGPESSINRFDRMRSLSVNDIIRDSEGTSHQVASFGFKSIDF